MDALVDLPFALPTAVAGITLTAIYSRERLDRPSSFAPLGIKIAFTPLGIFVALIFIGLPFVVRTVQPVLEDLDPELEEAAASLGANRWQTFWRVILPMLSPALLTGFALAFARALGEYGSVVFISGNMPMKTEITPLLIMHQAGAVRLRRRDGHRGGDARRFVRDAAGDQRAAMVEQPPSPRRSLIMSDRRHISSAPHARASPRDGRVAVGALAADRRRAGVSRAVSGRAARGGVRAGVRTRASASIFTRSRDPMRVGAIR